MAVPSLDRQLATCNLNNFLLPDLRASSTDAEERAAKVQEDVNAGIEAILETGSGILEKAKEDVGGHSETSRSKELGTCSNIQFRAT